ncbi:hypothetical protein CVT25_012728 [Psilocybe cyanescens]|uniref:HNH nuclease domain-containing protein n=1 Tax=Psilocybe cyanescens TaxID=93625 RepID=A0A409XS68_PSICY|nr:hypothetical protein CVT25_012728 [Psilocybe cyanescens]
MPESLPHPNPYNSDTNSILYTAYNKCLDLEARHEQVKRICFLQVLVCARFLGYMLLQAPTDGGRKSFGWEIHQCSSDDAIQELAQIYSDHLLRLFYRNKDHTPTPRSHPSVPSFNFWKQSGLLETTPSKHDKAKKTALYRDGYCCVLSRKLDSACVNANLVVPKPGDKETVTEVSYIFDRSTNENLGNEKKSAYAASAQAVLSQFGQIRFIEELNGENLHRLENILTLDAVLHQQFDNLMIWLEKIDNDPNHHQYKLNAIRPSVIDNGVCDKIELTTPDPVKYPLPDPHYLALHAACAQVVHLSGAGKYIEKVLQDIETIGVLASDGGSDVLYHALVRQQGVEAY